MGDLICHFLVTFFLTLPPKQYTNCLLDTPFMPPTLEKLKGHIAFGLSVCPFKI